MFDFPLPPFEIFEKSYYLILRIVLVLYRMSRVNRHTYFTSTSLFENGEEGVGVNFASLAHFFLFDASLDFRVTI